LKTDARCRLLIAAQPVEAGVPRHVHDVVRLLDPASYAMTVACPRSSELWHWLGDLPHVVRHAIASHREPTLWDAVSLGRLAVLVHRADIVHAHSAKAGFLARLAAAARGHAGKCIFTPHGWSFWSADGPRARFYARLERTGARWCRTILAVSDHERRAGLDHGVGHPEQYRVIRNGVDPERFSLHPAPVPMRVLFVGRLASPKRPDLVVHAIDRLRRRFAGVELHIVGDGPDRSRIARLIHDLGLQDRVHLLGKRADVPLLLARATCLAFASDYEACPLTVLEAKAAGVPVVATAVGGVPEIIDDGVDGILVTPGSVDAMAPAIAQLLANPASARAMGAAGRRNVLARNTSAAMAGEIAALYRETIVARPSSALAAAPAVDPP
jgi:glycosyltransferase involved in cell wall biosynthesis